MGNVIAAIFLIGVLVFVLFCIGGILYFIFDGIIDPILGFFGAIKDFITGKDMDSGYYQ